MCAELLSAIRAVEDANNRFQWAVGEEVDAAILELEAAEKRLRAVLLRLRLRGEACGESCLQSLRGRTARKFCGVPMLRV